MSVLDTDVYATRNAQASAHAQFIERWSPRAMNGDPLELDQLNAILEAARWAPSCFNAQPWRFVYALRDTPEWQPMFQLLMDANQTWAREAGALVAVISYNVYEHNGKPAPTASFDTGSAWMGMALQAQHMGLVAHAMWGFHHDKAPDVLGLSVDHAVQAMVAIGRPGDREDLPAPYDEREVPSDRKSLDEIAFAGRLP
jgi:nitroreductase